MVLWIWIAYMEIPRIKRQMRIKQVTDEEVEIMKKVYENDLLEEINKDREEHGKNRSKRMKKKN